MKRRSFFRNSIALVLSILLILGALPIQIVALDLDTSTPGTSSTQSTSSASSEYIVDSQETVSDELIGEVAEEISLREENVKHFRLSNGTYQAIVYPSPVHRKDQNGAWQDIDNRLVTVESVGTKLLQTPDSRVSFAGAFKANESLFTLSENGYSVEMALLAAPLSGGLSADATATLGGEATVTNAPSRPEVFDSIEQAARIDNRSSVLYQSVMPNTSIEYILKGNDVKENIIVSAPSGSYEYDFELTLEGLTATLDKKGNVRLCDTETGASRYVIPAPYMYDAEGELSTAVSYELYTVKDGLYLLRVSADATWINAEGRAFPVTVDPTLVWAEWASDVYVDSDYPDFNYDCLEELWVSETQTTYIYMPLPSIPSGSFLIEAQLCVPYYYPQGVTSGSLLAGAYQVIESWDPDVTTYENASDYYDDQLDAVVFSASSGITESTPGLASFTITAAMRNWQADPDTNAGIAIKREDGGNEHTNEAVILKAYEAGLSEDSYMVLEYAYHLPNGVYAIQNVQKPTRWMTVEDDSVFAGSYMQHMHSTTSPADEAVFDRSCLFKISQIGDSGRYVIRLMLNNNLTFEYSEDGIITKEIPSVDDDVPIENTFYIEWEGNGFWIYPYGNSRVINHRNVTGTHNVNLETISKKYATNNATWHLIRYTGVDRGDSYIRYTVPVKVGTTVTLMPIVWSTNIGYNTPRLTVRPEDADKATCIWDESSYRGLLALHNPGVIEISCTVCCDDQSIPEYSSTRTLISTLIIEEGDYVIKNKATETFLQIDGGSSANYNATGNYMTAGELDGEDYHKWRLIHVGNGYYKILSIKSNLAMCVKNEASGYEGGAIIQEAYSDIDRMKWKITKTSSDTYVLTAKVGEGSQRCATAVTDTSNDALTTRIEQRAYGNDTNFNDEWNLYYYDTAVLLAYKDPDDNAPRHDYFPETKAMLQAPNYDTISITTTASYESLSVSDMLAYLKSNDIFIIATHGQQNGFQISKLSNSNAYLTMDDLEGEDLSNIKFALLLTCNTGDNFSESHIENETPQNIIEQMVVCGAQTVIGFNIAVNPIDCNRFAENLMKLLIEDRYSVENAVQAVPYSEYENGLQRSHVVIAGDGYNQLR